MNLAKFAGSASVRGYWGNKILTVGAPSMGVESCGNRILGNYLKNGKTLSRNKPRMSDGSETAAKMDYIGIWNIQGVRNKQKLF